MHVTSDLGAVSDTSNPATPPYSESWWARLSAEDLHKLVDRGFAAGAIFEAAVAEARRREEKALELRQRDAAAEAEARRRRKRLGVVGLIATAVIILSVSATIVAAVF